MRSVLKKILFVVLGLVGIFVLWALIDSGYQAWEGYKWQKQTDKFQNALEQPYKEDTYGGKTPEETWGMFLDALKKGDIDLASKYYDVGHQEKAKGILLEEKNQDNLELLNQQLSHPLQKDNSLPRFVLDDKESAYYYYTFESMEKQIRNPVHFYLNPYTKVWKIVY